LDDLVKLIALILFLLISWISSERGRAAKQKQAQAMRRAMDPKEAEREARARAEARALAQAEAEAEAQTRNPTAARPKAHPAPPQRESMETVVRRKVEELFGPLDREPPPPAHRASREEKEQARQAARRRVERAAQAAEARIEEMRLHEPAPPQPALRQKKPSPAGAAALAEIAATSLRHLGTITTAKRASRPETREPRAAQFLRSRNDLRRAMIVSQILGRPRSEEPNPTDPLPRGHP
jgi:hypothetical protein